ncbi:transcriptional regulator, LysR family [Catenulispora acidiphila DSM 44928]|uniref:Transcriptional regulator, LysR family n=1 Tax=Catenulispora acidiphila (strain DSM 44928 / JCM 14897 / NBRC 102108 / NRRL B-24433 / ID139908) TaxID=479433 RepID=C7Q6W2_CATAD|nr:LysR family transcriptional regulator [Catenulispora acidiphila]ACU75975.1 transcriptional regulator, LysR family [Catenulispora acidiphila DSM 44928]
MERLELRHLRTLCAIADTGSLRRAAAAQGYSQPALTTQLQRIEQYFGEPLFARSSIGVVPTAVGGEIVAQARDVLARMDAIGPRGHRSDDECRTVRLAATNTAMLSGLVTRFRDAAPQCSVTVSSVYSSKEMVGMLEEGLVDIAIGVDYPGQELRHSSIVAHRGIVTEPSFVAVPAGHPLAAHREVCLTDLADDAWFLTPDDGAGWPGVFFTACEVAGFRPATVHEFLGDRRQLHAMIAAGLGVAVVQATFETTAEVAVRPLIGSPLWCRYLLAWRVSAVSDDVVDTVYRSASEAYRDLVADAPHLRDWAARAYGFPQE